MQRRAIAGLLWAKKHFRYDVREWLEGDPAMPPPPPGRARTAATREWTHLYNADIISMPDEWEYPWYAAWDLAFHMLPMAIVDPDFAKEQLLLFCREWYMHPNGQLPAYEWAFNDVNPPVHAWAAWRVYKIDGARTGKKDTEFLERIFHKLLINFSLVGEPQGRRRAERLRGRLPRPRQHRPLRPLRARSPTAGASRSPTPRAGWRCTA